VPGKRAVGYSLRALVIRPQTTLAVV